MSLTFHVSNFATSLQKSFLMICDVMYGKQMAIFNPMFTFVCLSGRLPQGKESGYPIRDLASHPRGVCNRTWNATCFPDWQHSRLVSLIQAGGIAWEQTGQFNPNTTIRTTIAGIQYH